MKARIKWKQYNSSGILIPELTQEREVNTFVKQYYQILCVLFKNASITTNVRDTGNTLRTVNYASIPFLDITSGSGVVTHGIVVGTGNTAVTQTDYVLETPIAHGSGAGQLLYSAMGYDTDAQVSGSKSFFQIFRTLTNSSGGDITIEEAGIYVKHGSTPYYFCIDRTIYQYEILDGNYGVATYEINNS